MPSSCCPPLSCVDVYEIFHGIRDPSPLQNAARTCGSSVSWEEISAFPPPRRTPSSCLPALSPPEVLIVPSPGWPELLKAPIYSCTSSAPSSLWDPPLSPTTWVSSIGSFDKKSFFSSEALPFPTVLNCCPPLTDDPRSKGSVQEAAGSPQAQQPLPEA